MSTKIIPAGRWFKHGTVIQLPGCATGRKDHIVVGEPDYDAPMYKKLVRFPDGSPWYYSVEPALSALGADVSAGAETEAHDEPNQIADGLLGLYQQAAYDAAVEGIFCMLRAIPATEKGHREKVNVERFGLQHMKELENVAKIRSAVENVYFTPSLRTADLKKGALGEARDIVAVLAFVLEEDADKGDIIKLPPGIEPTAIVQSSFHPRQNRHFHYLLKRALSFKEAHEIALLFARKIGGDNNTSNIVKPWRVPGTFNHPNWQKLDRGRGSKPQEVKQIGGSGQLVDPDAFRAALEAMPDLPGRETKDHTKSRRLSERCKHKNKANGKGNGQHHNGREDEDLDDRERILARLPLDLQDEIDFEPAVGGRSQHFQRVIWRLANFLTLDEIIVVSYGAAFARKYEERGDLEKEVKRSYEKWEAQREEGGHGGGGDSGTQRGNTRRTEGGNAGKPTPPKPRRRGGPKWVHLTEKFTPRLTSIANVKAALDYLGIHAWQNDFTCIPEIEGSAGNHVLNDSGVSEVWRQINALGFFVTDNFVAKAWKAIAKEDKRHPIRDWLNGLAWDKTKRLKRLFIDYAGAPDTPYNRALGILLGVAMVRRIRQPGYKFDHVILLRGPQDIAKSLFWQTLASSAYFTDNFDFGLSSKEIIEQTARKWLVEVAEMKGLTVKQVGHTRALITRQVDSARLAYAQGMAMDFPRQFVAVGTINDFVFLHDQHGNRRFDIIDVTKIDITALARDREQIFAEASELERTYGYLVLPDAVKADAKAMQDAALVRDHTADDIEDALHERYGFVSRDDIYKLVLWIGKDHPKRNDREIARVVKETVSRLGWKEIQRRDQNMCSTKVPGSSRDSPECRFRPERHPKVRKVNEINI